MILLYLFGAIAVVVGVGILASAVILYRRYRYLADLPTSTARATPAGLNEVKGRAVAAEEPFDSPFQEEPSVLCHYAFYGRRTRPRQWAPPKQTGTLGVPFYVEDDTGRILVRPQGAEIKLPDHLSEFSSDGDRIERVEPEVVERYRERFRSGRLPDISGARSAVANAFFHLDEHTSGPPSGPTCGAEARLEEGDEVYVIGSARRADAGAQGASDGAGEGSTLVIAADPEGGGASRWLFEKIPYLSATYGSIFEIFSGSEEELRARHRKEILKALPAGFLFLAVGLLALLGPSMLGGQP